MAKSNRLRDDWGSVSYDPKRRVGRIRYWSATPDGYRRVSETVRGTRKDVERRRAELRLMHDDDAPCPTIGQLYESHYRPWRARRVEEGKLGHQTFSQEESAWRRLAPQWADTRADSIRPALLQDWIEDLTVNQAAAVLRLLRGILKHATLRGLIDVNPLAGIEFELPTRCERRDRGIWTLDELGEIWGVVRGKWWEPAFLLMAFGSARVGEALGAMADEVERVRVDGVSVAVVPCVRQVSAHHGVDTKLKTAWSERPLVIPGPMGERVLEIAKEHPGDWLTSDGSGLFTSQQRLRASFDLAISRSGLEKHPMRCLRPSWETYMHWTLGVSQDRIEKMMGHIGEGSKVTAAHYDRPTAEEFAQTIAEAYGRVPFADGWKAAKAG